MNYTLDKYDNLIVRNTQQDDLDFVLSAERSEENAEYVGQWSKEQHLDALIQKDFIIMSFIENEYICES